MFVLPLLPLVLSLPSFTLNMKYHQCMGPKKKFLYILQVVFDIEGKGLLMPVSVWWLFVHPRRRF